MTPGHAPCAAAALIAACRSAEGSSSRCPPAHPAGQLLQTACQTVLAQILLPLHLLRLCLPAWCQRWRSCQEVWKLLCEAHVTPNGGRRAEQGWSWTLSGEGAGRGKQWRWRCGPQMPLCGIGARPSGAAEQAGKEGAGECGLHHQRQSRLGYPPSLQQWWVGTRSQPDPEPGCFRCCCCPPDHPRQWRRRRLGETQGHTRRPRRRHHQTRLPPHQPPLALHCCCCSCCLCPP